MKPPRPTCAAPRCRSPVYAKGLCRAHWYREWHRDYMRRRAAKDGWPKRPRREPQTPPDAAATPSPAPEPSPRT